MRSRARQWRRFVSMAIGTGEQHPLRVPGGDIVSNASMVSALTDAFRACYPERPAKGVRELVDYGAERFRVPWTCYVIRNDATGEVYVGTAKDGFVSRYPGGRWWEGHHNARLLEHVVMWGVRGFSVAIHSATDRDDMRRVEASLLRSHRPMTYNDRPEPDDPT